MIRSWRERRRKVEVRVRDYDLADLEVTKCRLALRQQIEQKWKRVETFFWIAVTGYIWASRRKEQNEEERGNFLAELLASLWVMNRWRRLTHSVSDAAQQARVNAAMSGQEAERQATPRHE